jgi:hypothetical protein
MQTQTLTKRLNNDKEITSDPSFPSLDDTAAVKFYGILFALNNDFFIILPVLAHHQCL